MLENLSASVLLRNEVEYLDDAEIMTLLQQVGVVSQISARQGDHSWLGNSLGKTADSSKVMYIVVCS